MDAHGWIARAAALALTCAAPFVSCGTSGGQGFTSPDGGGAGPESGGDQSSLTCAPPQIPCGATCLDPTGDPKNCGACGNACDAGALCCQGGCVETAACSFAATSATPARGNQNGGDWVKLAGNGFTPGMHVFIGDGAAPARTLDSHTAMVQTPPAPVGTYDIKIVSGAMTATLVGGFSYVAGGLQQPWQKKPLSVVRGEDPALAVLPDGRVLVAGGTTVPDHPENSVATAEIYTRSTDTVASAANTMSVPRWRDGAVTLLTGKALVVGGAPLSTSADLFDPSTNSFAPTSSPMNTARSDIRSVLMVDGRVLVTSQGEQTAEIYDPDKDDFTQIPTLSVHSYGFIVRLRDGRILLGGGDGGASACEIYDPVASAFKAAAPLMQGRSMATAHTLPDGRVMVLGGATLSAGMIHVPLDEIELYDPRADAWSVAPYKLTSPRVWHASALVRDGTILVMGGYNVDESCQPTDQVDQVDPVAGTVAAFSALPDPNTEWTAVTLLDGSVLGVGGGACQTSTALPDIDFLPGALNK